MSGSALSLSDPALAAYDISSISSGQGEQFLTTHFLLKERFDFTDADGENHQDGGEAFQRWLVGAISLCLLCINFLAVSSTF